MRIYKDFSEAVAEIKRDLAEMGIRYQSKTYQDKYVEHDPGFQTLEIQNYIYTVTGPKLEDLSPTQPWADAEFEERVSGKCINPGEAYKLRPEIWEQFLEKGDETMGDIDPQFSYTYAQRMFHQLDTLIQEAKARPESRQLYLSIWEPIADVDNLGGISRVPCSLGYLFQIRGGQLHMTYMMRSCDIATHFINDIYLAHKLQRWLADKIGVPAGRFTHYVGSLHVFQKDIEGVF